MASQGAERGARFSRGVQFLGVRRGLSGHGLVSIPNTYQLLETEYLADFDHLLLVYTHSVILVI